MKTLTRALASLLCVLLAVQPSLAHFARVVVSPAPISPNLGGSAVAGAAPLHLALPTNQSVPALTLPVLTEGLRALPTVTPAAAPSRSAAASAPQALAPAAAAAQAAVSVEAFQTLPPAAASLDHGAKAPTRAAVAERLTVTGRAAAEAVAGLASMPVSGAQGAAAAQFSLLTEEHVGPRAASADPVPAGTALGTLSSPRLSPANAADAPKAEPVPAPAKGRWGQVFKDPERNKSFWRYFLAEGIFLFGFEMYVVALPYLMEAFTKNTLKSSGKLDGMTKEAVTELVRQNRSMSRIAHWVAQAVSYVAIPLFNDGQAGPRKWLVRSFLVRGAVLAAIPALFFASGLLSAGAALWTLFGLIAVQSFFQGISATMDGAASARIMGDKSVTDQERLRANSLLAFLGAVFAIIAPAIAGKLAVLPDWLGKSGTGSAVIYGIYAACVALTGLVFASIRMLGGKSAPSDGSAGEADQAPARPKGVWDAIKGIGLSMKEGIRLVWKNRFLRTMLIFSLIVSLFSDPLIFNVLPEFVEGVLKASPATIEFALKIPVVGWFLQGLVSTPMGFYGLLVAFSSIGSVLATLLVEPLRKFFHRLGFKTEESLTIPFYALAFLEVPAFWAMIHFPSFWGVLLLYGFQTLAAGFMGLLVTGINQKQLSSYSSKQMNQVLAAESFVSILAAIASTYLYGFVLKGISIDTSLLIAAIATTVLGVLYLFAPWMLFSKAQRKGEAPPPPPSVPPAKSPDHEHDPKGRNPLSIGL